MCKESTIRRRDGRLVTFYEFDEGDALPERDITVDSYPKFRTEAARAWLLCSGCEKDIRELKPNEKLDIRRGYYCEECDDGVIHLNKERPK